MAFNFNLPPDLCADALGRALDGKSIDEAVETLQGQQLFEPARYLKLGHDLVGQCRIGDCIGFTQLTHVGNDVMLADLGASTSECVEPD